MTRAQFAALCGVSKQMISKYGALIVADGPEVDAAASLAALEGRLDEDKRQKALATLNALPPGAAAPASVSAEPAPRSAKAEKDAVELQLKQLQYARAAGEVVDVEAVDAAARTAVAEMREAFGARRREIAEGVCAKFGLPAEKAAPLARHLAAEFETSLGVFARQIAELGASSDAPAPSEAAARDLATA